MHNRITFQTTEDGTCDGLALAFGLVGWFWA